MNVGYFNHTSIEPSETFIRDLVKGLADKSDWNLTYVSGSFDPVNVDFELQSISSGYFDKNSRLSNKIYKVGQIFGGRGYRWQFLADRKTAQNLLKKSSLPSFDVAYVEYAISGVLLADYLISKNIPFVVHVHGYDVTAARHNTEYARHLKKLYQQAAAIITPSAHIKRVIVLDGCNPEKVTVIHPFQVPESLDESRWSGRYNSPPSLTFIGRLTHKKNPIALLHAFANVLEDHPETTLRILGDGDLMEACKARAARLGISDRVQMTGMVEREEAFKILCSSWIYVQHSVTSLSGDQEGFPVSLAEASAHALPLVSTIHSGITENIIDGTTGYLVQEYDYSGMAKRLSELIANPVKAEKMGRAAQKHIKKICAPGQRVNNIMKLLQRVAEHGTG